MQVVRGADAVGMSGRPRRRWRYREPSGDPARSENLCMHASLHAREPGDPMIVPLAVMAGSGAARGRPRS